MKDQLQDIYNNLDWIADRMDDLSERINDYVFFSGCDLFPENVDIKKLKKFDRECNELEVRYNLELKILNKLLDSENN
jgi:hypothetical protein